MNPGALPKNQFETKPSVDVLVLGAGPGALSIAAALAEKHLRVEILSVNDHKEPWPYTYGIWGDEIEELGLAHLLQHRWKDTVSFFGEGSKESGDKENIPTKHSKDYGLFDKRKLQQYWIEKCNKGNVSWHLGSAEKMDVNSFDSTVVTSCGKSLKAKLVIDATGYEPVFLKSKRTNPIAVQTCYGIVGYFNKDPVQKGQFVLMDYRNDHLSLKERSEPPTFLYAMDLGENKFFLEETSLGLYPPVSLDKLKERLHTRLKHNEIEILKLEHEELGIYLPMNLPVPDLNQPILGFGGSAGMVHPASGYMVGSLLRRAPGLANVIADALAKKNATPAYISSLGWKELWPRELRKKQALYQFGLEKLMRFEESQLRDFFKSFFSLPKDQWYGFLTNTLSMTELVQAMWKMFKIAPWNVKFGLMGMQGKELKLLLSFLTK